MLKSKLCHRRNIVFLKPRLDRSVLVSETISSNVGVVHNVLYRPQNDACRWLILDSNSTFTLPVFKQHNEASVVPGTTNDNNNESHTIQRRTRPVTSCGARHEWRCLSLYSNF